MKVEIHIENFRDLIHNEDGSAIVVAEVNDLPTQVLILDSQMERECYATRKVKPSIAFSLDAPRNRRVNRN